jgi:hypothetical protein
MISVDGKLDMAIITLGMLYFVLSCRLTLIDFTLVQHRRRAAVRPHVT